MPDYIHELPDWPRFRWDERRLTAPLAAARHQQGRLLGHMEALGFTLRDEAALRTLTDDVVKSSDIEGETLDADQVRSSVARRLGLDVGGLPAADRHVEGVVEMMLDATQRCAEPLTVERLFGWHASLFPTGRSGMHRIAVGAWRDDHAAPMQVVSGPVGRERVHFQAPAAARLDDEMRQFLEWVNADTTIEPVLKAALAHLWFVTLHPFDDGNGRIARALGDMLLARSEGGAQRFYSMSAQIREERADYYGILERTQQGTMDVTAWMEWFLGCLTRAILGAQAGLSGVIEKARCWERLRDVSLNDRQRLVIGRLIDGFEGNLTTSKWAALTKCSNDTALRDIQQLVERGVLVRNQAGGRSTSYALTAV
ncbi:MAG: Fic family protein [Acidobacteria bacterium]|nr:Fic family protein [Acidobacteriota bacterium]